MILLLQPLVTLAMWLILLPVMAVVLLIACPLMLLAVVGGVEIVAG